MKPIFLTPLLCLPLIVGGCDLMPEITNSEVKERVMACAAGFDDSVGLSLAEAFNRTALSGEISGDFKKHAQGVIFSQLPEKDRLVAYEDYLKCVEEEWNAVKTYQFNKKIKARKN